MRQSCTYIVPTSDSDVDRQCGKTAVSQVRLPSKLVWLCRQHDRKVRHHGQQPIAVGVAIETD